MRRFMLIRYATEGDIERCKSIASQFPLELPFINRAQFQQSVNKQELFVAYDAEIVGFIRWHACRDGWSTVYDLAVDKDFQDKGIGRMLLYAVPCPIRL